MSTMRHRATTRSNEKPLPIRGGASVLAAASNRWCGSVAPGHLYAGADRAGKRTTFGVGEAAVAAGAHAAAHRARGRATVARGRDAPVALALHHRLADDHLVVGQFGVALGVDAPGATRALLAGKAAELDEVGAFGALRRHGARR